MEATRNMDVNTTIRMRGSPLGGAQGKGHRFGGQGLNGVLLIRPGNHFCSGTLVGRWMGCLWNEGVFCDFHI